MNYAIPSLRVTTTAATSAIRIWINRFFIMDSKEMDFPEKRFFCFGRFFIVYDLVTLTYRSDLLATPVVVISTG
jgi:hypothetical protein